MTHLSWVALHGMAHNFIELDKAVVHVISLISFLCGFHSVCPLMEMGKRLLKASLWERLTEGELGLILMGMAMLSKSLIQFSLNGQGCVSSLLFDLRPNYGGGNEDNVDFLLNVSCTQSLQPCSRPLPTHTSSRDSWTLTGKSVPVSCGVTAPFSWFLLHTVLFVPSKSLFPQSCVSSGGSVVG